MSIIVVTLLSLAILIVGFLVGWLVGGLASSLSALALMALPVLVVGFLIGWLIEWIIDNQYRRMRELLAQPAPASPPATRAQAPTVQAPTAGSEIAELVGTLKEVLTERERDVDELRGEVGKRSAEIEQLKVEFDEYAATHPDDLTAIKGIGRIYQWKLRDGGINTYAALASSSPERVREIIQPKNWQKLDPASWIEQARALVAKK